MPATPFIDKTAPSITNGQHHLLASHTMMTGTFPLFWSMALFAATLHPVQPRAFTLQQGAFPEVNIASSKRDILGYGLRGAGLVENRRGSGGGMRLTRAHSEITLGDLLGASVIALSCPYRVSKKPQGTETGLIGVLSGCADLGEMLYAGLHSMMKEIPLDAAFPEVVAHSNKIAEDSHLSAVEREAKWRRAAKETRQYNDATVKLNRRSVSVVIARSSIFLPAVTIELNVPYVDPFGPLHKKNQTPASWVDADKMATGEQA